MGSFGGGRRVAPGRDGTSPSNGTTRVRSPLAYRYTAAARLLVGLCCGVSVATAPLQQTSLLASWAVAGGCFAFTGLQGRLLARRLLPAIPVLFALLLPLALAGDRGRAGLTAVRALAALACALSISTALPRGDLPGALRGLGLPQTLAALLTSLLRQVGAIQAEGKRMLLARELRGAGGLRLSADTLGRLLARTQARAERVDLAQRLRSGGLAIINQPVPPRLRDAPALAASAIGAICIHSV